MEQTPASSQDKLDRMLASGTITTEDYDRLSKAMHASDSAKDNEEEAGLLGKPAAKRLQKNWARRQIAGVCAGFSDYYALDLVTVRVIAVALAAVAPPVALISYIVLAFVLPWDDETAAREGVSATRAARVLARLVERSPKGSLVLTSQAKAVLALFLSLVGVVFGLLVAATGPYDPDARMVGFIGFEGCQLAAICLGYLSRKEPLGKVAVVTASVLALGSLTVLA